MITAVKIVVDGAPQGKGRARHAVMPDGTPRTYTPKETVHGEQAIAVFGRLAMRGTVPWSGPVRVDICIHYPIPKSWPQWRRDEALKGLILPTVKPDVDNVLKLYGDALNKVVWGDDAQIVAGSWLKRYSDRPRVELLAEVVRPARADR